MAGERQDQKPGGDRENEPDCAPRLESKPDVGSGEVPSELTRRRFLGRVAAATAGAAALGAIPSAAGSSTPEENAPGGADTLGELSVAQRRRKRAHDLRVEAAQRQESFPPPVHRSNGDDDRYPSRIASFTKGLPHDRLGEVDRAAYASLLRALESGEPAEFDRIQMGGTRPLVNPQAGLAFSMSGPDPHQLELPPAPSFDSAEEAGEMTELYWMALARDVSFLHYGTEPITIEAAEELSSLTEFKGPRVDGRVTPAVLFRSDLPGTRTGPFISQFLWLDTPAGAERIDRRIETAIPGVDYLTSYGEWLAVQTGVAAGPFRVDDTRRYIRNGRDLGTWVHRDLPLQAYLGALFILIEMGAPLDPGNPYTDVAVHDGEVVARYYRNQRAFGTLGAPHIAALVSGVTRPALAAAWFQKWFVHRRLRPEAFGGRVQNSLIGAAEYPIHSDALNAAVLERVFSQHGTYLLPQAFPEGSPAHPSYGAGHATVAGAAVTVLKALFDESFIIEDPVESLSHGTSLLPYDGPDLTVGGELNKLALNIATGRNFAGVHWRTDFTESVRLGEGVAVRYLRDELLGLNEELTGLSLTTFDGTRVSIQPQASPTA